MANEKFHNFLKKLYDILYQEKIIKKRASTSKEKLDIINKYFKRLENRHKKARENEHFREILLKFFYKRYIIKEENIPNRYWLKISKSYLDDGYGHINLLNPRSLNEITNRNEHTYDITNSEISTLNTWLNYFISNESEDIPMWAKVWAFLGMQKIGTLKPDKKGYYKRRKNTIYPFVSLNKDILKKCVSYLEAHFNINNESIPPEIDKLINSESFFNIYGTMLNIYCTKELNGNDGIWIKYEHSDKSASERLFNDLQGYNTGWCTATSKTTAYNQLYGKGVFIGGDFYIYYTKDQNGEYKIPRLAILIQNNEIAEARGIEPGEKVEKELVNILEAKLREFPSYDSYKKKVNDVTLLTDIYRKFKITDLTKEELRFIYELDSLIDTFGFDIDPRIKEILANRDLKADLSLAYNCRIDEIGIYPESFNGKKCYYGDIKINEPNLNNFVLPEIVIGNLTLPNLETLNSTALPKVILGSLYAPKVSKTNYLTCPKICKDGINFESLVEFTNITFPRNIIRNHLILGIITSPIPLVFPKTIDGDLILAELVDATNITFPKTVTRSVFLNRLTNPRNVIFPIYIKDSLFLKSLDIEDLVDATLPEHVETIYLKNNQEYTLDELKKLIAIEKAKIDLKLEQQAILENPNKETFALANKRTLEPQN